VFNDIFMQFFTQLLMVLATAVSGYGIAFLRKRLGVEKMKKAQEILFTHKELALEAVRFAEQRFDGEEKLQRAMEQLSTHSSKMGIQVDPELLESLVETAIRELKDSFGEEWGKTVK